MYLWGNNWRGDELLHFLLQFKFNSSHSLITQLLLGQDLGVTVGPTQVYKHTQSHIYSLHWGNSWWQWEFTYIWYIYSCSDVAAVFFLHVICEFVVKGFDVALATLQLLLKLAQVIVQLIQLTYSTDTQNNKSYIINELFYFLYWEFDWLSMQLTFQTWRLNVKFVTFEFLYGFGAGGNVLLQHVLEEKTQHLSISTVCVNFSFF